MTNDKETRNWTELAAENKELHEQLEKAQLIIAAYERAHAVAVAMAKNNDVLRSEPASDNRLIARARRWHGK